MMISPRSSHIVIAEFIAVFLTTRPSGQQMKETNDDA